MIATFRQKASYGLQDPSSLVHVKRRLQHTRAYPKLVLRLWALGWSIAYCHLAILWSFKWNFEHVKMSSSRPYMDLESMYRASLNDVDWFHAWNCLSGRWPSRTQTDLSIEALTDPVVHELSWLWVVVYLHLCRWCGEMRTWLALRLCTPPHVRVCERAYGVRSSEWMYTCSAMKFRYILLAGCIEGG